MEMGWNREITSAVLPPLLFRQFSFIAEGVANAQLGGWLDFNFTLT
jgi:hypothetical protein